MVRVPRDGADGAGREPPTGRGVRCGSPRRPGQASGDALDPEDGIERGDAAELLQGARPGRRGRGAGRRAPWRGTAAGRAGAPRPGARPGGRGGPVGVGARPGHRRSARCAPNCTPPPSIGTRYQSPSQSAMPRGNRVVRPDRRPGTSRVTQRRGIRPRSNTRAQIRARRRAVASPRPSLVHLPELLRRIQPPPAHPRLLPGGRWRRLRLRPPDGRRGAWEENRTPDLRITSALLYRLSYPGIGSSGPPGRRPEASLRPVGRCTGPLRYPRRDVPPDAGPPTAPPVDGGAAGTGRTGRRAHRSPRPVRPSSSSRAISRCPVWAAVSSIMWSTTQRTLGISGPSGSAARGGAPRSTPARTSSARAH